MPRVLIVFYYAPGAGGVRVDAQSLIRFRKGKKLPVLLFPSVIGLRDPFSFLFSIWLLDSKPRIRTVLFPRRPCTRGGFASYWNRAAPLSRRSPFADYVK